MHCIQNLQYIIAVYHTYILTSQSICLTASEHKYYAKTCRNLVQKSAGSGLPNNEAESFNPPCWNPSFRLIWCICMHTLGRSLGCTTPGWRHEHSALWGPLTSHRRWEYQIWNQLEHRLDLSQFSRTRSKWCQTLRLTHFTKREIENVRPRIFTFLRASRTGDMCEP